MQGSSWLPLFGEGGSSGAESGAGAGAVADKPQWRDAFLYEYWQEYDFRRQDWITGTRTTLAVRTDTHKLITYPEYEHWTEMYDLVADPYETRNLAEFEQFQSLRASLCAKLEALMDETHYRPMPTLSNMIELTRIHETISGRFRKSLPYAAPPLRQPRC